MREMTFEYMPLGSIFDFVIMYGDDKIAYVVVRNFMYTVYDASEFKQLTFTISMNDAIEWLRKNYL